MSCLWLSPPTTVRSCQGPETRQSSCGTHWPNASSPSRRRDTVTGCLVWGSPPTTPTPSLFLLAGIGLLRLVLKIWDWIINKHSVFIFATLKLQEQLFCMNFVLHWFHHILICLFVFVRSGTWPTASWRSTTLATLDTSTPWPFPPMAPCAPPEARTARQCSGTWMKASTFTPWTITTSSLPSASPPTVTGCALLSDPPSRFGYGHSYFKWFHQGVNRQPFVMI